MKMNIWISKYFEKVQKEISQLSALNIAQAFNWYRNAGKKIIAILTISFLYSVHTDMSSSTS